MTDRFVPLAAQIGVFQPDGVWAWGGNGINMPQQVVVLDGNFLPVPGERIVKVVPFAAPARAAGSTRLTTDVTVGNTLAALRYLQATSLLALTATGNAYAPEDPVVAFGLLSMPADRLDGSPPHSDLVEGLPQGSIVDIGSTAASSFALDSIGQLWAWSMSNDDSASGAGDAVPGRVYSDPARSIPFVTLTNVRLFATGTTFCIAQKTDGTWWAVGQADGQDGLSSRIVDGSLDGSWANGDPFFYADTVAPVWTEVPSIEALGNTVRVVAQDGEATLFIQADGTVWAAGLQNDYFSETNVTGIYYGQFVNFVGSGPLLGVHVDPRAYYPVQIPWASNIVDAACAAEFSLYLTVDGTVYFVSDNVNQGLGETVLAADGVTVITPNPGPSGPAFPPALLFPPGITCAGLLPGGGAVIGSDGRLYTLGATPDGSVRPDDLIVYNNDLSLGLPAPFPLSGIHNDHTSTGTVGDLFASTTEPTPAWAGFPTPLLSASHLAGNIAGGFSTFGWRVFTITSGAGGILAPAIARVVALLAFFRKGGAAITWGRVIGPV